MEYLKISPSEQFYGKRNLLLTEMEILNIIKRHQTYNRLRKDELKLRSALKRKVKEAKEELKVLLTTLPKSKTPDELKNDQKETSVYNKRRNDLEFEIDQIKEKLANLS